MGLPSRAAPPPLGPDAAAIEMRHHAAGLAGRWRGVGVVLLLLAMVLASGWYSEVDGGKLIGYVQKRPNHLKLRPDMKLVLSGTWPDAPGRLAGVKSLLRDMSGLL